MAPDLAEAHAHGHAHPHEAPEDLPRLAWGAVALVGATVAAAWLATWAAAPDFERLMMAQARGAAPAETATFLALSGVMMVAMMLPSGAPMFATYRGLAARDAGVGEARLRTGLFGLGYFLVWAGFTALSLAVLAGLGALGGAGGPAAFVPGALLVAAGVYQVTGWKAFCLRHCRSPVAFLMTHWRSGRAAALRMGLEHAAYCLGCCWLLMLVLFTAGAMSLLWMGVFALLILGEKVWSRGERFSQAMGLLGIALGLVALGAAALAPPTAPPAGAMDGMDMG